MNNDFYNKRLLFKHAKNIFKNSTKFVKIILFVLVAPENNISGYLVIWLSGYLVTI